MLARENLAPNVKILKLTFFYFCCLLDSCRVEREAACSLRKGNCVILAGQTALMPWQPGVFCAGKFHRSYSEVVWLGARCQLGFWRRANLPSGTSWQASHMVALQKTQFCAYRWYVLYYLWPSACIQQTPYGNLVTPVSEAIRVL
jgi:hypothetical protein